MMLLRRLLPLLLVGTTWLPGAEPRLSPEANALDGLPQEERWALIEAQEAYGKQRYAAAAIAWEKFGRRYPDSAMWVYAAWRRAEALRQDKRQDGAIAALQELVELSPDAVEVPEALLLLAECQAEAGLVKDSVTTAKNLLGRFPDAPAAVPVRLRLDDGLMQLAKQDKMPDDQLRAARQAALGPFGERIDGDPRNRKAVEEGLRRLAALALAADELPRIVALIGRIQESPQARDLGEVAWRAGREAILRAWTIGADPIADQLVSALWSDAVTRSLERGRLRLEWLLAVRRDPAAAAKAQGIDEKTIQERIPAELKDLATKSNEAAQRLPRDGKRDGLAWLAAHASINAGQIDQAAEQLVSSLGRPLTRRDAREWWELGDRAGIAPADLLPIVGRVGDERERRLADMDLRSWAARRLKPGEAANAFATTAVGIAAAFEKEDPERAGDYLGLQAELLRRVLGQHDLAIEAYARLNRPPETDFAISETMVEKGDAKAGAAKLSEIAAIHAGKTAGAEALWRLGRLLHRDLKDKAGAVNVLRQVCDQYPETPQYGEAHRYLQGELGVTYTGGGGKRQR